MTAAVAPQEFGHVLRSWRARRSRSQLALAGEAGVSQRHISFLETGRSRPSREMVVHLGIVLDLPLREQNTMLVAAGFAPIHPERTIDDPALDDIRRAIELMLAAHDPFPAYVLDRHWNLVLANNAATNLIMTLPASAQTLASNAARLMLHPDGIRTVTEDFVVPAAAIMRRLEREAHESPGDADLEALVTEVRSYPGVPTGKVFDEAPLSHDLVMPLRLRVEGQALSFFSTIATLASPGDITLQELRLETLLPADAATEAALFELRDANE